MQEKVREHRPLNLCYLSRVLTWGMEAQTPSGWFRSDSQVKWLVKKKMEADLRSLNRQSFCVGPSTASAGASHRLISVALRFMDCLGSLNCFYNCSAPLTENPTNIEKMTGEDSPTAEGLWNFIPSRPSVGDSQKKPEKGKEGTELQLRNLSFQLANGDYFFWFSSRINVF